MNSDELQKNIAQQKQQIEKAVTDLKDVPEEIKEKQEKILQLVIDELASLEKELSKYTNI
jgi:hypothetical protein